MNREFEVHKLNVQGFEKVQKLADGFDKLLTDILGWCPTSRELSIEACFFAKKAIANVPENQI